MVFSYFQSLLWYTTFVVRSVFSCSPNSEAESRETQVAGSQLTAIKDNLILTRKMKLDLDFLSLQLFSIPAVTYHFCCNVRSVFSCSPNSEAESRETQVARSQLTAIKDNLILAG